MWRVKPLSAIELRHLRYFLAAAEHGSFRKAGLALAVQESSISRRIRDLEDALGASLFQRHSGGVVLTLAGCELLRQTRTAMKHLGDGARDIGSIGRSESGHLRVGILPSLASGFLAELFHTYGADRKGVHVDFSDGDPMDHVAAVRLHELDVAFIAGSAEHAGCEAIALWTEQVFAALPSDHALADRRTLVWLDLVGEQFIVSEQASGREVCDLLMKRLSGLERHPQVRRQNVGRDNLMSLVAIGRGLTLTSEAMTSTSIPGLVYRPIEGESLPFSVVWSPKNDNPALRRLLSMARARSITMRLIEPPLSLPISPHDEPSQSPDPSP